MPSSSQVVDSEVLRLRSEGRPFAGISRDLGLDRPADAQKAFLRAVRGLPEPDAGRIRDEEVVRLDHLADRVRSDGSKTDVDRERHLKAIDRMRAEVLEQP